VSGAGSARAEPGLAAGEPPGTGDRSVQDFSLVLGGPLYQGLRRLRMCDAALGLVHRRIILAVLVTWAPVMALAAAQGLLVGGGLRMPLLYDYAFHLRFLVVTPLLILAELVVHWRLRLIVDEFLLRRLVPPIQLARFADAFSKAAKLRNSVPAEALLLALVLIVGVRVTIDRYLTQPSGGWFASPSDSRQLTLAGLWMVFVSLPIMQFLLLRWYFRLLIWARFLWQTSRLALDVNATHPDKAGGLGFLGESLSAFALIAAAQGVLVSGMLADRIFFAGSRLIDYEMEVIGGAVFLMLLFAGPLTLFAPMLARAKRLGLREYGGVAQTYVLEFRDKWLRGGAPAGERLIGSGDIQSLADLGNSYESAEQMRIVPITLSPLLLFVGSFLAPILPLVLTMVSFNKLIGGLIGVLF
jgi:hypothetical protein